MERFLTINSVIESSKIKVVSIGAEATIWEARWLGNPAILKVRRRKKYVHPVLLDEINRKRTRKEAKILETVLEIGVCAPKVYSVFVSEWTIVTEYLKGILLSELLKGERGEDDLSRILENAGMCLGVLHDAGITHGDYTVNNIIVRPDSSCCVIDFGLSDFSVDEEDRAMDLYLFYRSLISILPREQSNRYIDKFLRGYIFSFKGADKVLERFNEILLRGRYVEERRKLQNSVSHGEQTQSGGS